NEVLRLLGKLSRDRLLELTALRREQHYARPCRIRDRRARAYHVFNRGEDRFRLHHHPIAAAKRPVVDHPVLVRRILAYVVDIYFNNGSGLGSPDDPKVEDLSEELGKDR